MDTFRIGFYSLTVFFAITLALSPTPTLAGYSGGKYDTTTSGGTSSSGSGTTSSCIGAPSGGKYSSDSYSGSSGCTTEVPGTDSDGDSMLDTWETTYSLDKYNSLDRYADGDADNCTNACEHARNGVPNDNDSDNDGVADMDDAAPNNAGSSTLSVDSTYKGGETTRSNLAQ